MVRLILLACGVLGLLLAGCHRSAPATEKDKARTQPRLKRTDETGRLVDELIEQLASKNPEPTWSGLSDERSKPDYPSGFNRVAQDAALNAWDRLVNIGDAAFVQLVQASYDDRYSCTIKEGTWKNLQVGDVGYRIVTVQVEIYRYFIRWNGTVIPSWIDTDSRESGAHSLLPWWAMHKGKNLRELQIAATEWAIDRELKQGFHNDEEKKYYLTALEKLLERLKSSDKPIRVDRKGQFVGEDVKRFRPLTWHWKITADGHDEIR